MKRVQVIALLIVMLGLPAGVSVHASGPNQVGLVVQFGDGSVFTGCVEFSEPSISGYEALARAGLNVVAEFSGLGVAVCKIQNDGCNHPVRTCFCQCEGSPCLYWVYHHLVNGTWQYSGFGASSHQVAHGAVEGWAWGQGDPSGGAQPPVLTFEQLCAPSLTATLPPGMTPQPLAIAEGDVIAAPTLPPATATPVEVAALPAEPAVAPAESADETAAVDSTPPYLVFGGLVVALVGVLLFVTWRRRTA